MKTALDIIPIEELRKNLTFLYVMLIIFCISSAIAFVFQSWIAEVFLLIFVAAFILGIFTYRNKMKARQNEPQLPFEEIVFPVKTKDFSGLNEVYIIENANLREIVQRSVLHSFDVFDDAKQKVGFVKESWIDISELTNNPIYGFLSRIIPPSFLGVRELGFYNANNELFMKARQNFDMGYEGVIEILTAEEKNVAKFIGKWWQGFYILNSKNQVAWTIVREGLR